jgi:hypothetical protein
VLFERLEELGRWACCQNVLIIQTARIDGGFGAPIASSCNLLHHGLGQISLLTAGFFSNSDRPAHEWIHGLLHIHLALFNMLFARGSDFLRWRCQAASS